MASVTDEAETSPFASYVNSFVEPSGYMIFDKARFVGLPEAERYS